MKNKTFFALIVLSATLQGSVVQAQDTNKTEAAPQPAGTPKIAFDNAVYDFGTTSSVTSVTGTFTFHNTGDAVLEMKKPVPGCGCTVASVKPETLKPGEKGELVFTLNVGITTRGLVQKNIAVPSNDPVAPNVNLTVKVNVVALYEMSPQQVSLPLRQGMTTNVTVRVKRVDGKKLELTSVQFEPTNDLLHAQFVPVESPNGTETDIRIEAASKNVTSSRGFSYQMRVYADNPKEPALMIPVFGQMVADLTVAPEQILWPIADPDRWPGSRPELMNTRGVRVIANKPGTTLDIKNLTSSLPELTVNLVTLETGRVYQVVAKLTEAPKESERGTISFDTNMDGYPRVVVPVTINVMKR